MDNAPGMASEASVSEIRLGKRRWRLAAVLIDAVIGILAGLPLFIYFDVLSIVESGGPVPLHVALLMLAWGMAAFVLINYRLLDTRGQTVGKWCVDLAIVGVDGSRKSALHILIKRVLPTWVAGMVPFVGNLLVLVDSLFILGKDKRCIHDRIAGTKVIDIGR